MTFDDLPPPSPPMRTTGGDRLRAALADQLRRRRRGAVILGAGAALVLIALLVVVLTDHSGPRTSSLNTGGSVLPTTPTTAKSSSGDPPAKQTPSASSSGTQTGAAQDPLPRSATTIAHAPSGAAAGTSSPTDPSSPDPTTVTTVAARPRPTPTSTTVAAPSGPASCKDSALVTSAATDQSNYDTGQTVVVTITLTNDGPSCSASEPLLCGLTASATNDSGDDVWDSAASPDATSPVLGCPNEPVATIPNGWSASETVDWNQGYCTVDPDAAPGSANPSCPETQVPEGGYSVVALFDGATSSPASISIYG